MLRRLKRGDEVFLHSLMTLDKDNAQFSVPTSLDKWKILVDWSVKAGEKDLYWIITSENQDCGYIGFTDAKNKMTMRSISPDNSLFLELYLLEEFRGRGIAFNAYMKAKEKIGDKTVYASTYITNLKAQRFFADSLGMKISHYYKNISIIFVD